MAKESFWDKKNIHWMIFGLFLLSFLLFMIYPYLDVFVWAVFIYYVSRPIYNQIRKEVKSETVSAFISLFLLILPIVLVVQYTISVAAVEFQEFSKDVDSPLTQTIRQALSGYQKIAVELNPKEVVDIVLGDENARAFLYLIATWSLDIIFKFVLVFVMAYYLLKDGSKMVSWFRETFCGDKLWVNVFLDEVDAGLYHVFFGNILTAALTAVIAATSFVFLNAYAPSYLVIIPYPVLLGMLCGIASLIPLVGLKLVWVPLFLYMGLKVYVYGVIGTHLSFLILFLIVINIVVDIIPDLILRPYIAGRKVHQGAMLLSYIFGPTAFGTVGILVGPLTVVIATNFGKIVLPQIISYKKE
ncbi:AI-2E family transporter [Candidatus Altiarchaeota archaeon]